MIVYRNKQEKCIPGCNPGLQKWNEVYQELYRGRPVIFCQISGRYHKQDGYGSLS